MTRPRSWLLVVAGAGVVWVGIMAVCTGIIIEVPWLWRGVFVGVGIFAVQIGYRIIEEA